MRGMFKAAKKALRAMRFIAPAAILVAALASRVSAEGMDGCPDYAYPCPCPLGCQQGYCEQPCTSIGGTDNQCYDLCGACQCLAWASMPVPGVLKLLECLVPVAGAVETSTTPASGRVAISNPHGTFYRRPRVEAQKAAEESAGIGVALQDGRGKLIISGVESEGPAAKAGLKAGDEVVRVDGKGVKGVPLQSIVEWIRGRSGTMVTLVVRGKGKEDRKVSLVRMPRETFARPKDAEITTTSLPLSNFKDGSCPRVHEACHLLDVQDGQCVYTCRRGK